MKRLLLASLFIVTLGLGTSALPEPACADQFCGKARCATSYGCPQKCACIGGWCVSFQAAP